LTVSDAAHGGYFVGSHLPDGATRAGRGGTAVFERRDGGPCGL